MNNNLTSSYTDIAKPISQILPPDRFSSDPVDLMTYAYDGTGREYPPNIVVFPQSAQEVAQVLKLANERRVPVYPRGGGTGLTGGSLAVKGGIALSLERMSAIKGIDEENRLVTAQTGIRLGDLKSAVQQKGLFFPPDPSSAKTAQLGGCLAECAGGLNCVKYGTTKDWVQTVEAVLVSGEIIHTGARVRKSVVGYNLLQLLIGSEGTLAVITEATLRLIPYPTHRATFIALFDTVEQSAQATVSILQSGITPSALEFIDYYSLEAVNTYAQDSNMPVVESLLLIETDGFDETGVVEQSQQLQAICRNAGTTEIRVANTEPERALLWKIRKNLSPAMYAKAPFKANEDICVPISQFPHILREAYKIGAKYNLLTMCFGHAGDGNIHANLMSHKEHDPDVEAAVKELFEATVACGGSISGEHGIGITKADYIHLEIGERERALHRQIKDLFDPNHILNPGKFIEHC